jgi:hypothetical protein
VAELDTLGYQVVETQSFTNEVNSALSKLKEKDTRIILGNFNERWARMIFCEAYKLEMYGRKYQWVIMGTYSYKWWQKNEQDNNCTQDDIELALQQTILTDLLPLSTSGEITISGIVSTISAPVSSSSLTVCRPPTSTRRSTTREEVTSTRVSTAILTTASGLSPWRSRR